MTNKVVIWTSVDKKTVEVPNRSDLESHLKSDNFDWFLEALRQLNHKNFDRVV